MKTVIRERKRHSGSERGIPPRNLYGNFHGIPRLRSGMMRNFARCLPQTVLFPSPQERFAL